MKRNEATAFSIYETPAGFGIVAASGGGLVANHLPYGTASTSAALEAATALFPAATGECAVTAAGAERLAKYFAGQRVLFDLPLDLGGFTQFQVSVYRAVEEIEYGKVMSYGEVAAACGSPKGARAIGAAMANNPLPIFIPCHRVVARSGLLTGFTAPGGIASKRELLMMEGAVLDSAGMRMSRDFGRL